jgi:hypothetical protein
MRKNKSLTEYLTDVSMTLYPLDLRLVKIGVDLHIDQVMIMLGAMSAEQGRYSAAAQRPAP